MPQIYRLNVAEQNCWICKHFRRDDLSETPNEGSCTSIAPRARGGVDDTNDQDDVNAHITYPDTTYCGDFEPWEGVPREPIQVQE